MIFSLYKDAYTGLPRSVWLLSGAIFINRAGTMVIMYMMLYLTQVIGADAVTAGRVISVYGIGSLFGTLLGGRLSDIVGTRRVQVWSLFLTAVAFMMLSSLTSLYLIAGNLFLLAVVAEAFRPANTTAIAEVSPPEKRARAFALNRLAINLGFSIGPVVGGLLARIDYRYLFYVDAATCALAGIYLLLFDHRTQPPLKSISNHKYGPLHLDGVVIALLSLLLMIGVVFFQLFNSWPLYLKQELGFAENRIGPLMALNGLLIVLLEMPLIHKLETHRPLKAVAVGALLICLGFGLLPFGTSYMWIALTVVCWTLGEMLALPLTAAFIANRAPEQRRGQYLGLYNFTFAVAQVAAPTLGAWIYQTCGAHVLWYSIGLIGILLFGGFMLIHRRVCRKQSPYE